MAPVALRVAVCCTAWQSYRVVVLPLVGKIEAFGGNIFPNGWVVPFNGDFLIGLLAPAVTAAIATQAGSIKVYIMAMCYYVVGLWDFYCGLLIEKFCAPKGAVFGEYTPKWMLTVWLLVNWAIEIVAFGCMLREDVFAHFNREKPDPSTLEDGVLGGYWLIICGIGWSFPLIFPCVPSPHPPCRSSVRTRLPRAATWPSSCPSCSTAWASRSPTLRSTHPSPRHPVSLFASRARRHSHRNTPTRRHLPLRRRRRTGIITRGGSLVKRTHTTPAPRDPRGHAVHHGTQGTFLSPTTLLQVMRPAKVRLQSLETLSPPPLLTA